MENEQTLVLRHPKNRAVCIIIGGLAVAALVVWLLTVVVAGKPDTLPERIINSVCFFVLWVAALFAAAAVLGSVRDLVAAPSVVVDNRTLCIEGREKILLADIAELELSGRKSFHRSLLIKMDDAAVFSVKQKNINIPIETLEYAIEIRRKALYGAAKY